MPCYVYRCPAGHTAERIREIAQRHAPFYCEACHASGARSVLMALVFAPPASIFPGAKVS